MKKVRCFFAAIALVAALSGFPLQGMASVANAASGLHASTASVTVQVASSGLYRHYGPPCPGGGTHDC